MKEELKNLLRENKTAEIFERLRQNPPRNKTLQDEIIRLSARFKEMEQNKQGALADSTSLAHEHNRINDALLNVINQLGVVEKADAFAATPNSGDVPPVKSNSKPMNWALIGLLFMGILVGTNLFNRTTTKFEVAGTYHDKSGGTAAIIRVGNNLTVKLDNNNRKVATGVIMDGNTIEVNYLDDRREMSGTLRVNPNRIQWSNDSEWYKDKNP